MELLTCTKCRETKPATVEFFPPHNKKKNGLDSWCRRCRASYRNEICRGRHRRSISDSRLKFIKATVRECVICGSEDKLVVDHDHATGEVRGLLCSHCNRGLGHFRDSPELLEFARMYLLASSDSPEWEEYCEQHKETARDPDSRINKSLRAWNC